MTDIEEALMVFALSVTLGPLAWLLCWDIFKELSK